MTAALDLFASPRAVQPKPLREHQLRAIGMLRQSLRAGNKRVVLQLPTGAGKTRTAAEVVSGALGKGNRVAFTVPAISLIDQTVTAFEDEGIDAIGVIQACHVRTDRRQPVQVCSVATLGRRQRPDADVIIVDECHAQFAAIKAWMRDEPEKVFIGLSATPWARGMAEDWQDLIVPVGMQDLIDRGFLSPFRAYAPSHPDMAGVRLNRQGDYENGDSAEVMGGLVADVVDTWKSYGRGLPTLVFAVNRAHAAQLVDQFAAAGVAMGYCDKHTDLVERKLLFAQMARGEIAGIVNIATLTTGVDADVRCIVLARPTRSEMLFVQMVGRGLRTAPGKSECIARDTLILTDKGPVRIQDVTLDHKVWDGVAFVAHSGAVCKGVQPVITYDGVTATPDHMVMTDDGWLSLEAAADRRLKIARTGLGGIPLRFTGDYLQANGGQRRRTQGRGLLRALLRYAHGALSQYQEAAEHRRLSALQWSPAGYGAALALSAMPSATGSLPEPQFNLFRAVRRAWSALQLCRAERGGDVDCREHRCRRSQHGIGPDRQQRSLRTGQFALGSSRREHEQQTEHHWFARALHKLPQVLSRSALCRSHTDAADRARSDGRANSRAVGDSFVQAEGEVWDILNAGPLQRFTANGRLVHNCVILDHADNHARLGFVTDIRHDRLLAGKDKKPATAKERGEPMPKECGSCGALKPPKVSACPACGFKPERQFEIEVEDGELIELRRDKASAKPKADRVDKQRLWSELIAIAADRNRSRGWASHAYRERMGVWPRGLVDAPIAPSPETIAYVRSKDIRWAKSKGRAA